MAITYLDADSIIEMREQQKLSWVAISENMGLNRCTCLKHYNYRKEGGFYFSEFAAKLNNSPNLHTVSGETLYASAVAAGYEHSYKQFIYLLSKHGVMYQRSAHLKRFRMEKVYEILSHGPTTSIREAIRRVFYDYSDFQLLKIEKEMCK